nr:thermonuclease family protein [Pseudomonas sp.]
MMPLLHVALRLPGAPATAAALASLALLTMLVAMPADAQSLAGSYSLYGTVERVLDGDTVLLDTGTRRHRTVRLASIDAPEARKPDRPGQPFAQSSKQALADLVQGRRVTASCYETDSYERDICELLLPDGRSVNRAMVQAGMAWANMEGKGKYL